MAGNLNKRSIFSYPFALVLWLPLLLWACESPQQFALRGDNQIINLLVAYAAEPTRTYTPLINDYSSGEIQVRVPSISNASLTQMRVLITIPAGAVVTPAFKGNMDLSKPYRFSIIAENGDKKDYLLFVYQ
jgi:hypothetical protein